jgi:aryl-alcohol dehydrogenase-like predicted oxidoreductase
MQPLAERYMTEANWRAVEELEAFCAVRGRSLLELAFNWLAAQPVVTSVIAGATRPEQLEQNVRAMGWTLTPEELADIDRITRSH